MNDNTKLRIKVSKRLFESIAKEVLAEAKGGDYAMRETKKMMKPKKGGTKKLEEMDKMKQPKMEMNASEDKPMKEYIQLDPDGIEALITQFFGAGIGGVIVTALVKGIRDDLKRGASKKQALLNAAETLKKTVQKAPEKGGEDGGETSDKV